MPDCWYIYECRLESDTPEWLPARPIRAARAALVGARVRLRQVTRPGTMPPMTTTAKDRSDRLRSLADEYEQAIKDAIESAHESGTSYAEIARQSGGYRTHLSAWMAGKKSFQAERLDALAKVVGVRIEGAKVVTDD